MSATIHKLLVPVLRAKCSACGTEATCDCNVPYLPAGARAAAAVAATPEKSNRAIAVEIGVSDKTVAAARAEHSAPEKVIGRDGKEYPAKAWAPPPPPAMMPQQSEVEVEDDTGPGGMVPQGSVPVGITFADFIPSLTSGMNDGSITQTRISEVQKQFGLTSLFSLNDTEAAKLADVAAAFGFNLTAAPLTAAPSRAPTCFTSNGISYKIPAPKHTAHCGASFLRGLHDVVEFSRWDKLTTDQKRAIAPGVQKIIDALTAMLAEVPPPSGA